VVLDAVFVGIIIRDDNTSPCYPGGEREREREREERGSDALRVFIRRI